MSLVLWLPLNGDLENKGISQMPSTFTSVNAVYGTGKTTALAYDTSIPSTSAVCPGLVGLTTFSIAYWAKIKEEDTFSNWADLWALMATTNGQSAMRIRAERQNTTYPDREGLYMTKDTTMGGNTNNYYSAGTIDTQYKWYHTVMVKTPSQVKVYRNGILTNTRDCSTYEIVPVTLTGTVVLGLAGSQAYLNDFRVYNHALSATEVKEIAQGLVLHYKLDNNGLGNKNLFWGTLSPSTTIANVINILGTKFASGQGSTYTSHTRTNRPHGIQSTVSSAARPYIALGHPTAATCLAAPDPMWGLTAGQTYTFSGDLEYKVYSGNLELASYFVIRLYYIKSGETAWTNAGNLKTFTTHPGEVHNYHFELPFTIPEDAISWYILIASNNASASHNAAGDYVAIDNIKLEMGDIATPYAPAPEDFGTALIIEDSSGYNHNLTLTGALLCDNTTPRYSTSMAFNGATVATSTSTGADIRTISCWVKTTKNKSTSQIFVADSGSNMCVSFYNGTVIGVFGAVRSTGSKCTLGSSYKENDWNHIVVVKTSDDGMRDIWCNGEKLTPTSNDFWSAAAGIWLGARNASLGHPLYGSLSDVRFYCTPLLDIDIKQLYNVGMKVDNGQNIHTHEIKEEGSAAKIKKTATTQAPTLIEGGGLLNNIISYSIKPGADATNQTSNSCICDFSEVADLGVPIALHCSYTVSWSNMATSTAGTLAVRMQGSNTRKSDGANVWAGANYIMPTAGGYTTNYITISAASGSQAFDYDSTIPASWFDTYTGSRLGIRIDYSDGNGTITVSNIKVTYRPTAQIGRNYIKANQFIER